jgi:hypothetical protein
MHTVDAVVKIIIEFDCFAIKFPQNEEQKQKQMAF